MVLEMCGGVMVVKSGRVWVVQNSRVSREFLS